MFSNSYHARILSILDSVGSKPLSLWKSSVKNGHIKRISDPELRSLVLEIMGLNVATTFINSPNSSKASLGIHHPFLVIVAKNLKKYFTFEVTILDDANIRRRFRASNFQSATKVKTFCTTMPISLSDGWNQIQFNLADFTMRAYNTKYMETCSVQVHANVRLRRIYFSDRIYSEEELPNNYKLHSPVKKVKSRNNSKKPTADNIPPAPPHSPHDNTPEKMVPGGDTKYQKDDTK